jgi:hypothetical protein
MSFACLGRCRIRTFGLAAGSVFGTMKQPIYPQFHVPGRPENRRLESESWILLLNLSLLFSKHETLALQLLLVITRVIYPQITVSIL